MTIPNPPLPLSLSPIASHRPSLFGSVRSSRDWALAAFGGAVLAAFALHAGAFLPRLEAPAGSPTAPSIEVSPNAPAPAPAVMARRAPARGVPAAATEPCPAPRG
jgi:hypothetical protein